MRSGLHHLISKLMLIFGLSLFLTAHAIVDNDSHEILFNPPDIKNGVILSVQDCVSLAFKNSPKIRRKKYELDIAKNNVKLAQSRYFPVLGAGVGFQYERNSDDVYYDKKYRDLPNVSVAISKMIWDFGRTSALIKMEKFYKIAAEYEFVDELCHTLFDIKAKYYTTLRDAAYADIAKENVDLNKRFLNIAHGDIDKTTAKVYTKSSDAKHLDAVGNYEIAKINLANSMYIDSRIDYSIKNTPTFLNNSYDTAFKPIDMPFEDDKALDIAYKNSPDLAVLNNTKNAMEESLNYVKKAYMPELSAGIGYGFNNTNFASNNNMTVGVNLSSSINAMELKYSIDNSKAQISIADNEIQIFKKDLEYEILRALGNVDYYGRLVMLHEQEVKNASNTLDLAFKKYKNNQLDYTALHDSIEDYIYAKEKYILNLYNYNMSLIQTEMAMHYHMVDIHHKAEHAMHHHADELIEHLNAALDCNKKENKKNKIRKKK